MQVNWENPNQIHKSMVQGIVDRAEEERRKLDPIYDSRRERSWGVCENVTNIDDRYQIAEYRRYEGRGADRKETSHGFAVYVDFEDIHEAAESFDKALLIAIAYKYTGGTVAAQFAAKVLSVRKEE